MKACPITTCKHRTKTGCHLFPGKSIQRCQRYADAVVTSSRKVKSRSKHDMPIS